MPRAQFDQGYMTVEDIVLLQRVSEVGVVPPSTGVVRLWHRGMLKEKGLHAYEMHFRGALYLRGVVRGNKVRIADSYHLPHMRGKMGTVLGYFDTQTDAPGYDEWGYQTRWPIHNFRVDVKVDDMLGTWCFYKTTDLEGFFLSGK